MTQKSELKDRVAAKQKELEARLHTLRADAQTKSREEVEKLEAKLDEMKSAVKDGWEKMTEASAKKLNELLD